MNDEEKKAISYFRRRIANKKTAYINMYFKIEKMELLLNLIEKQQKEIEKKDKIINEMADRLEFVMKNSGIGLDPEHGMNFTINDIKEYFTKKVGE